MGDTGRVGRPSVTGMVLFSGGDRAPGEVSVDRGDVAPRGSSLVVPIACSRVATAVSFSSSSARTAERSELATEGELGELLRIGAAPVEADHGPALTEDGTHLGERDEHRL